MKTKIIEPDGIIKDAVQHALIYGKGAHATDLLTRGLFVEGTTEHHSHHLVLPITATESAILELLGNGVYQTSMISYAGVMSKAPNGIPSVHALWGPAAKTKLKVAVAMETFGPDNKLMKSFFSRMKEKNIRIVETNKTEHDVKMATIQGLIHLWLVIVGNVDRSDLQQNVIQHWQTPIGTITDMIHANPFAELVIKKFFKSLQHYSYDLSAALRSAIDFNLKPEDIEKFGTHNAERVMGFIHSKDSKIVLPREEIEQIQIDLNTQGHLNLTRRIEHIRKLP